MAGLREKIVRLAEDEARLANNFSQAVSQRVVVPNKDLYKTQSKYTAALKWGANQWCADFITWLVDSLDGRLNNNDKIRNSLVPSGDRGRWVPNFRNLNNAYATYYARGTGYTPKKGDFAILNNSGHIGIVNSVNTRTKQYTYIDGNNTWKYSGYRSVNQSSNKSYLYQDGLAGFVSINYEKLDGPVPEPISPDRFESNNTRYAAKTLSGESGTLSNLTLHNASDEDWFKFDWHGDGTASNQIRLSATSSNECFDLYSPSGSLLRSNTTIVTLAPYDRVGTYYVKVHGVNGSTSKNYALTYNLKRNIRPDSYESNNSRYTATPLNGSRGSLSNLTLHSGTDEDWFKVTLNGRGTTRDTISVSNSSGGEFIRLYNASGVQVNGWGRNMNFDGLSAGTYYAKVYNGASVPSSRYTLTWSIPSSVASSNSTGSSSSSGAGGSASSNNNSLSTAKYLYASSGTRSDSISRSGEQDYFRIQLNSRGTSNNYVQTSFTHSRGDIDMDLLDSSGRVLESKTGSSNSERIDLNGRAAGTYYVRVKGYRNATNNYSISWNTSSTTSGGSSSGSSSNSTSQREYESNNSRYTADTLSGTAGTMKGSIGSAGDKDYFKFNLSGRGTASNKLELTSGNNSQRLILYDANGGKISGSLSRSISLSGKAAGTYYVEVYDSVGFRSGDYTLSWNTASNSRSASSATSRAATSSLTNTKNVMYDSAAGAFAGYLNSAGVVAQAVSQSTSDSLRKYGTLVQA